MTQQLEATLSNEDRERLKNVIDNELLDSVDFDEVEIRNVIRDLLERYKEFIILNYKEGDGSVRYDEGRGINLYTQQESYEDEIVDFLQSVLDEEIENLLEDAMQKL